MSLAVVGILPSILSVCLLWHGAISFSHAPVETMLLHSRFQSSEPEFEKVRLYQELPVPFALVRGQLWIGHLGATMPAIDRLCLYVDHKAQQIYRLSDLQGKVRITTPQQALAFVRLPTSPLTRYCSINFLSRQQDMVMEVILPQDNNEALYYGYTYMARRYAKTRGGYAGFITKDEGKQLGIKPASCVASGQGFEVQRHIVVRRSNIKCDLLHLTEWVGPDGEYRLKKSVRLKQNATPVHWNFVLRR